MVASSNVTLIKIQDLPENCTMPVLYLEILCKDTQKIPHMQIYVGLFTFLGIISILFHLLPLQRIRLLPTEDDDLTVKEEESTSICSINGRRHFINFLGF